MTVENRVSFVIPHEVKEAVLQKLTEVDVLLKPFLIALQSEERKVLPKMSDGSILFVSKTLSYIKTESQFVPAYFEDICEKLTNDLSSDTTLLSGSEAYVAALSYYNSVKNAAKMNVPGAKAIYDDLKKRFENKGPSTPPDTPPQ